MKKSISYLLLFGFIMSSFPLFPALAQQISVTGQAAESAEKDARSWFEKGALLATYGNSNAAIRAFKKAIAIDSGYTEAYFSMGVVYGDMGDYPSAIAAVNQAIGNEPENGRFYYGRGWIYQLSGVMENALADFRKAAGLGNPEAVKYLEEIATRTPKV